MSPLTTQPLGRQGLSPPRMLCREVPVRLHQHRLWSWYNLIQLPWTGRLQQLRAQHTGIIARSQTTPAATTAVRELSQLPSNLRDQSNTQFHNCWRPGNSIRDDSISKKLSECKTPCNHFSFCLLRSQAYQTPFFAFQPLSSKGGGRGCMGKFQPQNVS